MSIFNMLNRGNLLDDPAYKRVNRLLVSKSLTLPHRRAPILITRLWLALANLFN